MVSSNYYNTNCTQNLNKEDKTDIKKKTTQKENKTKYHENDKEEPNENDEEEMHKCPSKLDYCVLFGTYDFYTEKFL